MKILFSILLSIILNASCNDTVKETKVVTTNFNNSDKSIVKQIEDNKFLDSSYTFKFSNDSMFYVKILRYNPKENKSSVLLNINYNDKISINFKDSIICDDLVFDKKNIVEYRDLNGDKINDLLILTSTDGHNSNQYELYLIDNKRKFNRVKNFSKLYNPEFIDSINLMKCEKAYRLANTREEYFKWKNKDFVFVKGEAWLRESLKEDLHFSKYSDKSIFLNE